MALSIPLAETVRVEMPRVHFCATEAMSGHIKEWVKSGEIDLALLYDEDGIGDVPSATRSRQRQTCKATGEGNCV